MTEEPEVNQPEQLSEQELEERRAKREFLVRRLDAGQRQFIMGYQWSRGDITASETTNLSKILLLLLNAYVEVFGTTDAGATGFTKEETYDQVMDYLVDLSMVTQVRTKLEKRPSEWELEFYIIPTLEYLEPKWSKITKVEIKENPSRLEIEMDRHILKLAPKLIAQLSTVVSLESRGFAVGFNPAGVPRFRTPQLDGARARQT